MKASSEQGVLFAPADVARQSLRSDDLTRRREALDRLLHTFSVELILDGTASRAWKQLEAARKADLMPAGQNTEPLVLPALFTPTDRPAEAGVAFSRPGRHAVMVPLAVHRGEKEWQLARSNPETPLLVSDAELVLKQLAQLAEPAYAGINWNSMTLPSQPETRPAAAFMLGTSFEVVR